MTNASTVVITHTVAWMRPTGTPSVEARSERSAAAADRDADPRVPQEQREPDEHERDDDEHHEVVVVEEHAADLDLDVERRIQLGRPRFLKPNQPGMNSASAVRSCATPIVATVRTRRGDRQNRLMNVRSTTKPRKIAATMPMTIATG